MELFSKIVNYIWGFPLIIFVVGSGIYFSKCIHFIQIRKIPFIIKNTVGKLSNNSYSIIMRTLGSSIGSGNIAGVASAIAVGGPGAVFWMWVTSLVNMGTKMIEVSLSVYYSKKNHGNKMGGAMYYISAIKGKGGKLLSIFYTVSLLVYIMCAPGFVQLNTISSSLYDTFNINKMIIFIIFLVLSIFIIFGGLKRTGSFLNKCVPFMCILYLVFSVIVISVNYDKIFSSLCDIFKYAFKPAPVIGGFLGSSVISAISKGSARGILANEAGTGASTIVHSKSDNKPIVQGMWGIIEVYIISFIICSITALCVLVTSSYTTSLTGAPMVLNAFNSVYGSFGKCILCFVMILFAYTTYIGFYEHYSVCIRYLFNDRVFKYFKWLYLVPLLSIFIDSNLIWLISDVAVALIIIPNIISLWKLSSVFKNIYDTEIKELES